MMNNLKKERSSNLELYRILCMLAIIAHHYVVNSGLMEEGGLIDTGSNFANSIYLLLFGMWGKTGINCFVMITGYFMCQSQITLQKFLKLLLEVYFYRIVIFIIFLFAGYESVTPLRLIQLIFPVWNFDTNFTSCFLAFFLTIPFLNILIKNMTQRQHLYLLSLLFFCFTLCGSIPKFIVGMNYVTWFGVIYLLAAYVRIYPIKLFEKKYTWMWVSLGSILSALASVVIMFYFLGATKAYFWVSDSNKFFTVLIAFSTFIWFKNLDWGQSKIINVLGASTFGIFLIHTAGDSMRKWLWQDTIDCIGHYSLPIFNLMIYSTFAVFTIFIAGFCVDWLRIQCCEIPVFKRLHFLKK